DHSATLPAVSASYNNWSTLGIEPRTPSTLRKDHTTRPSSQCREKLCAKATVVPTLDCTMRSDSFLQASSRYDRLLLKYVHAFSNHLRKDHKPRQPSCRQWRSTASVRMTPESAY